MRLAYGDQAWIVDPAAGPDLLGQTGVVVGFWRSGARARLALGRPRWGWVHIAHLTRWPGPWQYQGCTGPGPSENGVRLEPWGWVEWNCRRGYIVMLDGEGPDERLCCTAQEAHR